MLIEKGAEFHWTPPGASEVAAVLNRTIDESGNTVFPHVEITGIPGLQDLAEPGSAAHKRVGRRGEVPRRNFRGGKSPLYTGIIRARTERELEEYRAELRAAFEDQSAEGRMDHIPRTAGGLYTADDARFFNASTRGLEMAEASPGGGLWRASFVLALRNHDGRYFEELTLARFKELIVDMDPALYWALDNIDGGADLSGNGRGATAQGGVGIGGSGTTLLPALGGPTSTDFDGTDDRIVASGYNPFVPGEALTIIGFTHRDTSNTADTLLGTTTAPAEVILMTGDDSQGNLPLFYTNPGVDGDHQLTGPWTTGPRMFALTYDDPTSDAHLFFDGVEIGSDLSGSGFGTPSGDFQLGRGGTASPFDGKVAQLAIFERVLTTQEIADIYLWATDGVKGYY
jgi:hypothetical protein